ncbi:MAG TPA: tetratricopeptide repeat protein [Xanthobacteraceae bacterium]|nr:tetratricopeptide repeat protein [Xanthobacteraceae bacterium]
MACGRTIRNLLAAFGLCALAAGIVTPALAQNDAVRASIKIDTSGGYGRFVFTFSDDVDASVHTTGNVLIVSFGKPVMIPVDRIPAQAPDYVSAARRDPDGKSIRLALARKVKVNSVVAGEKYFVDLLPEGWVGDPPGLPQDVIAELIRRAKEADRLERLARQTVEPKKPQAVTVRVASQPTFTRYVFDIPDQTTVAVDRAKDRLTLSFDTPIVFDLTDAIAALPPTVAAINTELEQDSSRVHFGFLSKVDLRTFRDGKAYVVDVVDAAEDKADQRAKAARQSAAFPKLPPESENGPPADATEMPTQPAATDKPVGTPVPAIAAAAPVPAVSPLAKPNPAASNPAKANPPMSDAAKAEPAPQDQGAVVPSPSPAATKREPAAGAKAEPAPQDQGAVVPSPASAVNKPAPVAAAEAEPAPQDQGGAVAPPPASAVTRPAPAAAAKAGPPEQRAADGGKSDKGLAVEMTRQGANLKLSFPFMKPTAAAVFNRADTLWIVFDSTSAIDLSALDGESSRTIRAARLSHDSGADVVRIRLDHPHLSSIAPEGQGWTVTIGDTIADPIHALDIARNMVGPNRASVAIPFDDPQRVHRLHDPEAGDDLLVVTGFAPARGLINEQDFIEFHALASSQGIAIEPIADDVVIDTAPDKVVISRPGGLTLSSSLQSAQRGTALHPVMFDAQLWGFDRHATFNERQSKLIADAAAAPARKRLLPRLDLARFYLARDMYSEAKGVLDVALTEQHPAAEDLSANVLRAVAEVMMDRPTDALKDLSGPEIGDQHDAPLWRALAFAGQGKWGQARDNFKRVEAAVATLPIELQRIVLKYEMHAAIEVKDFAGAADNLNDLETIGIPHEMQPAMSVLIGRLAEGMNRTEDALSEYQNAADSWDRPAAAQGKLRETALRYALGDIKRPEAISSLETLTTVWRGDDTEIEALEILARLYTEENRYRDSFYVMRSAIAARPNSDMTRRIQDQAAATFEQLFLGDKGDALPAVDALALFYDFRELTPIGRRGDEMIRRLADRLVSVDLLDQAAELLQYQVDHRLQGAARAQVATRLAVIYLMNRKADRALATLRSSRTADLANELRDQRILLEARALSDLGRYDLALEVIASKQGRETIRLRSDILWAARRWAKAAEQIELYYADRWKEWQPLNELERADILRATVGYALGEDALGLSRFREKYAAKMAQTPDARAFEVASAPLGTSGSEFRNIAHLAASVDTLEGFLRDMKARYPEASPLPPAGPGESAAISTVAPTAPATRPAMPAAIPPPTPPARASGRTAQR